MEKFYTVTKLPVITPDNCLQFAQTVKGHDIILWSWFSGTSALSFTMLGMPFQQPVCFPVDLRYGWDLKKPEHQRLLAQVDNILRPFVTTMEPRCKYWSRAGRAREPIVTAQQREDEQPMLKFATQHSLALAAGGTMIARVPTDPAGGGAPPEGTRVGIAFAPGAVQLLED